MAGCLLDRTWAGKFPWGWNAGTPSVSTCACPSRPDAGPCAGPAQVGGVAPGQNQVKTRSDPVLTRFQPGFNPVSTRTAEMGSRQLETRSKPGQNQLRPGFDPVLTRFRPGFDLVQPGRPGSDPERRPRPRPLLSAEEKQGWCFLCSGGRRRHRSCVGGQGRAGAQHRP